jgi:signal transduction histidine kinase
VATAIANVQARTELAASRARLVAAADDERRRVVRDLHCGAQQRLVHTVITLKLARRALAHGNGEGERLVGQALDEAQRANVELRELAHGILPAVLTRGAAYFVVAEALTNVAKHARAHRAVVASPRSTAGCASRRPTAAARSSPRRSRSPGPTTTAGSPPARRPRGARCTRSCRSRCARPR